MTGRAILPAQAARMLRERGICAGLVADDMTMARELLDAARAAEPPIQAGRLPSDYGAVRQALALPLHALPPLSARPASRPTIH